MPRILCLHGHGTSSKIFESQLFGLKRILPEDYELVFADGEVECDRAPGVPQTMPGPFLCYFSGCSFEDLRAAHELLQVIIEEEGPFDGIFAFSQGASLTLSYLLELERHEPGTNPPIKFAILFSPIVALSPDKEFCADIVEGLDKRDFDIFTNVESDASGSQNDAAASTIKQQEAILTQDSLGLYQADSAKRMEVLLPSLGTIFRAGVKTNFLSAAELHNTIAGGDTSIVPRAFHPALLKERVRIPTVHVTGTNDHVVLQTQFKVLPLLCQKSAVKRVIHGGGHDVPRAPHELKEVVKAIEWAVAESRIPLF